MNAANLKKWGAEVGLSDEQMTTCLNSKDMKDKLAEDVALGNKLGVDSTPTLFINGRKLLGGRSINDLKSEIDQLLN
jgi:protein-disulfide isomerase